MAANLNLLIAQFRAYGGTVTTNVVDGHNIWHQRLSESRLYGTRGTGKAGDSQRRRMRQILRNHLAYLRNPPVDAAYGVRWKLFRPEETDLGPYGLDDGYVGVWDEEIGGFVAWCHTDYATAVLAGLADDQLTREA